MAGLFIGQRGVSPLVATILLIAFSVALGAVVMSVGESYVEENAEFVTTSAQAEVGGVGCDLIKFSIPEVRGAPQVCYRQDAIDLVLENGQASLNNLQARIIGSDGVWSGLVLSQPLASNAVQKVVFATPGVGVPLQVKLVAQIVTNGELIFCAAQTQAVVIEDINPCA